MVIFILGHLDCLSVTCTQAYLFVQPLIISLATSFYFDMQLAERIG